MRRIQAVLGQRERETEANMRSSCKQSVGAVGGCATCNAKMQPRAFPRQDGQDAMLQGQSQSRIINDRYSHQPNAAKRWLAPFGHLQRFCGR